MRKTMMVVAALVLAGCASAGGGASGSPVREILRRAGGTEPNPLRRGGTEYFVVDTVAGTPERAFNAVRLTYESLGFAFSYYEPDQGELGTFVTDLHDVDHESPSAWMTCGQAAIAGDNANIYSVSLTLGTKIVPLADGRLTIQTAMRAWSFQRDHSSYLTRCATNGKLEERIADGARDLLAKYGGGG